jgi:3-methyladenine DNA glycosylase/8-oxoguanine DNA glycosylase
MASSSWTLSIPPPFDFRSVVYGHGWVVLSPTSLDEAELSISRIEQLGSGKVVRLVVRDASPGEGPGVRIQVIGEGRLGNSDSAEINRSVGRMFRADENFQDFYALCEAVGDPWNRLMNGSGRLLRSPTLFEDMVKTICTTNIQWSGTKSMVRNLVEAFGEPFPLDPSFRAFPTPEAIAGASQELLAAARLGYRGPYISKLAQDVANGDLDIRSFEDPDISTEDLRKNLLRIKGIGRYAAATLLMLLGRYEYLGYDTEMRDFIARRYLSGENPSEKEAYAIYKRWGKWKYLAYWFDIYPVD